MNKYLKLLSKLNFKTIYFNLRYLPFKQAIQLPIFVSSHVYLRKVAGQIRLEGKEVLRPGLVQIGYGNVGIFDNKRSRTVWEVAGTIVFKGRASIGHGSKISVGEKGTLVFGKNFVITAESSIVAFEHVSFGDNCLLSWNILLMDTDFHKIKDESGRVINQPKPIRIEDKVWIGCRSLILKGAAIPINCVIGADSIVSKRLEKANSLYAGSPARCIKENITWEP